MPMLTIWKCPVCGTETEPFNVVTPTNWITVAGQTSTPEVFDSWQCAASWAQEHAVPVEG